MRCFRCGGVGHITRECDAPDTRVRACFLCGGLGHARGECPNGGSGRGVAARRGGGGAGLGRRRPRPRCPPHPPTTPVICFRCNRPGHIARDCTAAAAGWAAACLRCGRDACPDACAGRCAREGGAVGRRSETALALLLHTTPPAHAPPSLRPSPCTQPYQASDLKRAVCLACGQAGHLCCAPTTAPLPPVSCFACGEAGHAGDECRRARRRW